MGLKEVHCKDFDSTGDHQSRGILFSLEGFKIMLLTIYNFTQGHLHSIGGIQISFLGGL